jgi:hypothetical protein
MYAVNIRGQISNESVVIWKEAVVAQSYCLCAYLKGFLALDFNPRTRTPRGYAKTSYGYVKFKTKHDFVINTE